MFPLFLCPSVRKFNTNISSWGIVCRARCMFVETIFFSPFRWSNTVLLRSTYRKGSYINVKSYPGSITLFTISSHQFANNVVTFPKDFNANHCHHRELHNTTQLNLNTYSCSPRKAHLFHSCPPKTTDLIHSCPPRITHLTNSCPLNTTHLTRSRPPKTTPGRIELDTVTNTHQKGCFD